MLSELGLFGEGPAVIEILQGTYQPPEEANEYMKLLLKELYMLEEIQEEGTILATVTVEEHKQSWKKQKEFK